MLGFLKKIFNIKTKSEKDIEQILPVVEKINSIYSTLSSLSNDELRAKTLEFKKRIQEYISDEQTQIQSIKERLEKEPDLDVEEKEKLFKKIE